MTEPDRRRDHLVSDIPPAPYPTDGTDFRGAVRYHYGVSLKKFLTFFPVFLLLWGQIFVTRIGYLLPVAIIGMLGLLWTLFLFAGRMDLARKCSRVFKTYPLEFRTPVEKDRHGVDPHALPALRRSGRHPLHLACEGRPGAWSVACRHHGRRLVRR